MATFLHLPHEADEETLSRVKAKLLDENVKILKGNTDFRIATIATPVVDQLIEFARKNQKFAEAILDGNKTLKLCFTAALVGVQKGSACSEIYSRAAQYYYPGCAIKTTVELVLEPEKQKVSAPGSVSWLDFV